MTGETICEHYNNPMFCAECRMTEQKAREFWIAELLTGEVLFFREYQSGRTKFIEASALQAANQKIAELEAEVARLPIMPEKHRALEIRVKELEAYKSYVKESTISLYEDNIHRLENENTILNAKLDRAKLALQEIANNCIDAHERGIAREALADLERE